MCAARSLGRLCHDVLGSNQLALGPADGAVKLANLLPAGRKKTVRKRGETRVLCQNRNELTRSVDAAVCSAHPMAASRRVAANAVCFAQTATENEQL